MKLNVEWLLISNVVAIVAFVLKEIFSLLKDRTKEKNKITKDNTMAILTLSSDMRHLADKVEKIEGVREDMADVKETLAGLVAVSKIQRENNKI